MDDYQRMYHMLFHAITDAIESLQAAQLETEELFIATEIKELKKEGDS